MAQWMNLQQFCKSDAITFNVLMCEKSGAIATPNASGSYDRLADRLLNFSTGCIITEFNEGSVLLYCYQCISVSVLCKVCFGGA